MSSRAGRLELIHGCMFSGKTTELIRRLTEARQAGAAVVAIKPRRDTRYAHNKLVSHAGEDFSAAVADDAEQIRASAGEFDVVAIDEVHFFDATVADACRTLVEAGRRVIVAGVDLDHRGQLLPAVEALLAIADDATRMTARCVRCGGVAEHSQRMVDSDERIVVGGTDLYEPRCASCFHPPP
jgi:thymidine kinase